MEHCIHFEPTRKIASVLLGNCAAHSQHSFVCLLGAHSRSRPGNELLAGWNIEMDDYSFRSVPLFAAPPSSASLSLVPIPRGASRSLLRFPKYVRWHFPGLNITLKLYFCGVLSDKPRAWPCVLDHSLPSSLFTLEK